MVKRVGDGVIGTREAGDWEMTYHLYHDGVRTVEERNGSDQVIRQYVWGRTYVDELCQIGINICPASQTTCNSPFFVLADVNYNVIGLVNSTGALVERYEYTPYGRRRGFISPGANDSLCQSPTIDAQAVTISGVAQPYGLCDAGHQGLFFDKEWDAYDNRARILLPDRGRFGQTDPIGYIPGMNDLEYLNSNPATLSDPGGLNPSCCSVAAPRYTIDSACGAYAHWIGGTGTYAELSPTLLGILKNLGSFQDFKKHTLLPSIRAKMPGGCKSEYIDTGDVQDRIDTADIIPERYSPSIHWYENLHWQKNYCLGLNLILGSNVSISAHWECKMKSGPCTYHGKKKDGSQDCYCDGTANCKASFTMTKPYNFFGREPYTLDWAANGFWGGIGMLGNRCVHPMNFRTSPQAYEISNSWTETLTEDTTIECGDKNAK